MTYFNRMKRTEKAQASVIECPSCSAVYFPSETHVCESGSHGIARLPKWLLSLGFVLLVYGGINGGLYLLQHSLHGDQQQQLEEMKATLEEQRQKIELLEADLLGRDRSIETSYAALEELKSHLEKLKKEYPSGIPAGRYAAYSKDISRYNDMVRSHNAAVLEFKSLLERYSKRVERFNGQVAEANELSGEIGGTVFVVPSLKARGFSRTNR